MNREMFLVEIPHFVQAIAEKKITKSKSFTQENEKNDPAKGKKYHLRLLHTITNYYCNTKKENICNFRA